eukprot:CAMPEP_0198120756 /NCGR_PEP_ID=MMETSP1442-20131203/30198_1 /TAXON_ID= /ORGANISM="Craspedostauros australis, Strain CCMP3328" /LENGTH=40 /DNA_ID= /DNA_START= /DNA_END= /DNA_ORIENTATION=
MSITGIMYGALDMFFALRLALVFPDATAAAVAAAAAAAAT